MNPLDYPELPSRDKYFDFKMKTLVVHFFHHLQNDNLDYLLTTLKKKRNGFDSCLV